MAMRLKRSISLPPELDEAIEQAAALEGTSVSAWLADTAAHRLRLTAGIEAVEEWEAESGALTSAERADGRRRAMESLQSADRLAGRA